MDLLWPHFDIVSKMIKAIIFDCFGVLVTDGLEALMIERKITDQDNQKIMQLVTEVNKGSVDIEVYRNAVSKILGISAAEYIEKVKNNEVKNQPLLNFIKDLRKDQKIGMLSNVSSMDSLLSRFEEGELSKYFDVVIASGQIGFAKPEAQAYEITAEGLGARLRECLMVDDREEYCQGAVGVGMRAVIYKSFEQMKSEFANLI